MENIKIERRANKRAFFPLEEEIPLTITNTFYSSRKVSASLSSLSRGGLSFIAKKDEVEQFIIGDRLIIQSDKLPDPVHSFDEVEGVIIYINNIDIYTKVSLGCMFLEVDEETLRKIDKLVINRSKVQ